MADDALDETLRDAQEQFLTQAQEQIDTWHADRELLIRSAEIRFANVGIDINHLWQGEGKGQTFREVRTPKDVDGWKEDFLSAIEQTKDDREWRDIEQSPAYQAWEREKDRPFPEPDAEDIGWRHEQRWLEFEQWIDTRGLEGHPHYEFLNGQTPAEVLLEAGQARAWREEGCSQQDVEQETAGQAAWERLEASALLQAFEGKSSPLTNSKISTLAKSPKTRWPQGSRKATRSGTTKPLSSRSGGAPLRTPSRRTRRHYATLPMDRRSPKRQCRPTNPRPTPSRIV
jgi:hypothetical protein